VRASNNRFRVRLLGQGWRRPLPAEHRALGLEGMRRALVREVLLECAGEPWVFARSVIPAASLAGELRHLRRFGERSLGALLFSTQGVQRGEFEVARLAPGDPLLAAHAGVAGTAWARRSLFRLRGRPLLVQEVFLPACRLGPPL
jgi:chorismate--pyruvate lyase